jgi:hypothetical protein
MIVGMVTSATFTDAILQAFYAGLRAKGFEGDPFAPIGSLPRVTVLTVACNGKYDDGDGAPGKHQELDNTIKNWDADPAIDLIAAVGGLVSAHAAAKFCQHKPFLLLYGTTPNLPNNPHLRGAVNLDLIAKDVDRHDEVCSLYNITDPKKICLIWNANSKMGKDEKKSWVTDNGWPLNEKVSKNSHNDIAKAFQDAKADGAKGVVVSGDPYFTSQKDALVAAANASGLKVCYPFGAYKAANPAPTPGSAVIFGPSLDAAYTMIGEKTGTILTALKAGQPAPQTEVSIAPTGKPEPLRAKKKKAVAKKSKKSKKSKY